MIVFPALQENIVTDLDCKYNLEIVNKDSFDNWGLIQNDHILHNDQKVINVLKVLLLKLNVVLERIKIKWERGVEKIARKDSFVFMLQVRLFLKLMIQWNAQKDIIEQKKQIQEQALNAQLELIIQIFMHFKLVNELIVIQENFDKFKD